MSECIEQIDICEAEGIALGLDYELNDDICIFPGILPKTSIPAFEACAAVPCAERAACYDAVLPEL